MHGLVNRAIQRFVVDSYGAEKWSAVVLQADLDIVDFEAMWTYEDSITPRVLAAVCDVLDRPYAELLEDIGTYLVSHPKLESLRRLLRFSGVDFLDFLQSLDDLPGRARLAVSDLDLPHLEVREHSAQHFSLTCKDDIPGTGYLFMGVLRAMADDYGALVVLEHKGAEKGVETVAINLLEAEFSEGKGFELGARAL